MSAAALQHDAFAPQRPAGMRAGLVLAILAHLLLIAALTWSVRWHASEPEGVVAELWSATPQIAAPRPAAVEPSLPPPPPPPPQRVEPRPQPVQPPPRVAEPPRDVRADAQIGIERAAAAKTAREEAAHQAELAKKQLAKKEEAQRAEVAKREQARRAEDDKRSQQLADEQDRKKQQDQAKQDEKKLAAIREANLKRAMSQAGSSDEATTATTGNAARSSGPSASYAGRIKARIKPNIVFTASISGNPLATVEVRCAPDGTIVGRKLTKSSGSPAWDEAVLRAIDKTEVLPRDTDGRVPPAFSIDFKPFE